MNFTKMHGCGNDFLVTHEPGDGDAAIRAAPALCDRRTGVGADGLILISHSDNADMRMRIINADGSEPEMCGNGIRCAYRYVRQKGISSAARITFETLAGPIVTEESDGLVRVNMGRPILRPKDIPVALDLDRVVNQPLVIDGETLRFTAVSMGNPHAVFHVGELTDRLVLEIGAKVEHHRLFPRHVNVEFITVLGPRRIRMRVFERGVGETRACGTGACAAAVAGILTGRHGSPVTVELPGGELIIAWAGRDTDPVWMSGPAVSVFDGTVALG